MVFIVDASVCSVALVVATKRLRIWLIYGAGVYTVKAVGQTVFIAKFEQILCKYANINKGATLNA